MAGDHGSPVPTRADGCTYILYGDHQISNASMRIVPWVMRCRWIVVIGFSTSSVSLLVRKNVISYTTSTSDRRDIFFYNHISNHMHKPKPMLNGENLVFIHGRTVLASWSCPLSELQSTSSEGHWTNSLNHSEGVVFEYQGTQH